MGTVLADPLPPPPHGEGPDRDGGAQQRHGQPDPAGHEDRDHRSASASASSPATREPFTSTTSPGRAVRRTSASAPSGIVVGRDVVGFDPLARPGDSDQRPRSPTVTSRSTGSRAASSPRRSCSCRRDRSELGHVAEHGDQAGVAPPSHRAAFNAAAIDSGFALYASLTTRTPSARRERLHPPARHGRRAQRRGARLERHPERSAPRRRRERVGHHVLPRDREGHRRRVVTRPQRERRAAVAHRPTRPRPARRRPRARRTSRPGPRSAGRTRATTGSSAFRTAQPCR